MKETDCRVPLTHTHAQQVHTSKCKTVFRTKHDIYAPPPPTPVHPAYSYRVLYVWKAEHGSLLGKQRQGDLEFKVTQLHREFEFIASVGCMKHCLES